MAVIVKLPKCGINMEEGTVLRFYVKEGDHVSAEQPLAELETDKTVTEITAPEEGYVLRLLCPVGQAVPILTPVLAIGAPGESFEAPAPAAAKAPAEKPAAPAAAASVPAPAPAAPPKSAGRVKASPLAKKIAAEQGIDLRELSGTGPEGGILRRDVLAYAASRPAASAPGRGRTATYSPAPVWDLPVARRIPLKGMRRAIADNMSRSKTFVPHFQLSVAVDMTEAMELRRKFKDQCGLRVSYNDILARAAAVAMKAAPAVNASVGDGEILEFEPVNVGVAVGLEAGLIVPVIRDVDKKALRQVAEESAALIQCAREGRLPPESCTCGTITISNLGMYAVDSFTAIVNAPESCILAVGRIEERPVGRDGQIVLRPMMNITASFDHRVVDGAVGAAFLTELKTCLENPFRTM